MSAPFRRLRFIASSCLLVVLAACGGGGDTTATTAPPPPPPPPVVTAPTASFAAATNATAGQAVVFDASASTSSDGSVLAYSWDFGDGQHGGGKTIARAFATAGTHSVNLTVVDGAGLSATHAQDVVVTAPAAGATVAVHGHISGLDGAAIEGVAVQAIGSAATATSDASGGVALSFPSSAPVTIKLTKGGLADQFVNVTMPSSAGADAYFEATMRTRDAALTLADAAAGGTLAGSDGAGVTFPAGALVDGSGAAVSGPVQVSITPVDVTQPLAGGFPGTFDGIRADGTTTPIVSFGTAEFAIYAGANRLQLGAGKTATIVVPIYAAMRPDGSTVAVGDTTPLWSLDETTSTWIQEGTGTVIASADSPSGLALQASVSHFSWWNSDLGFDPFGPKPRCVYDTDSGIPGGEDTFATATICNMLAQFDRGSGAAAASRAHALGGGKATALAPQVTGYARRAVLPIAGGVTIPVPANVNIALEATALNGTWHGSAVINGPVGALDEVLVKMRPIATTGPGTEAITVPFDATRGLQTGQTALYSFSANAAQYVRITPADAPASNLSGHVRLLQGSTVLAASDFGPFANGVILMALPADGTYLVELTGTANTPGVYRLQVELLGGKQSESLGFPFDATRTLDPFTTYRGSFSVNAATTVYFGYANRGGGMHLVRVIGSDGSTALFSTTTSASYAPIVLALPAAGTYTLEVTPQNPQSGGSFRITGEPTMWQQISTALPVASFFATLDLIADRNGAPVVGVAGQTVVAAQSHSLLQFRRWTGSAWQNVGPDIDAGLTCGGSGRAGFAFDSANQPIVVSVAQTQSGNSVASVQKLVAGAWQPVGPNGGTLPVAAQFGGGCQSPVKVVLDASDVPLVAYRADNTIVVLRFDGTAWHGLAAPDGDLFSSIFGDFDLRLDAQDQPYLAVASSGALTVQRFTGTTWQAVGPNGGLLAQTNTSGLNGPQIRFDASGKPIVATTASVGIGISSAGAAVYRFDGNVWSSSGGYQVANSRIGNTQVLGYTLFGGDALVAWSNQPSNNAGASPIVQRNTAAGWSAFGPDIGEIPQFTPHGVTPDVGSLDARLLTVGGELYETLIINSAGLNAPTPIITLVLLHKIGP